MKAIYIFLFFGSFVWSEIITANGAGINRNDALSNAKEHAIKQVNHKLYHTTNNCSSIKIEELDFDMYNYDVTQIFEHNITKNLQGISIQSTFDIEINDPDAIKKLSLQCNDIIESKERYRKVKRMVYNAMDLLLPSEYEVSLLSGFGVSAIYDLSQDFQTTISYNVNSLDGEWSTSDLSIGIELNAKMKEAAVYILGFDYVLNYHSYVDNVIETGSMAFKFGLISPYLKYDNDKRIRLGIYVRTLNDLIKYQTTDNYGNSIVEEDASSQLVLFLRVRY
jgi:hypothetical protein